MKETKVVWPKTSNSLIEYSYIITLIKQAFLLLHELMMATDGDLYDRIFLLMCINITKVVFCYVSEFNEQTVVTL